MTRLQWIGRQSRRSVEGELRFRENNQEEIMPATPRGRGRPVLQRQRLWGGKKLTVLTHNPVGDDFSPRAYVHSLIEIRSAKRIYMSLPRAR